MRLYCRNTGWGMNYGADEQSNWCDISAKNVDSLDSDFPPTSEDELSHSSASEPESICTDAEW